MCEGDVVTLEAEAKHGAQTRVELSLVNILHNLVRDGVVTQKDAKELLDKSKSKGATSQERLRFVQG